MSISGRQHLPFDDKPGKEYFQRNILIFQGLGIADVSFYFYTPNIRSMWGYIVFAFPFVSSYVRSSFRHRVKVFALKFIRPHILETLWWISFIFGMMVGIGLKFLSAPSLPQGWPWGQGHRLRIFIKKGQSFCVKVCKTSYFGDPLMDFIHIWHDGRYRSKIFISTIPTPGSDLGVKVTESS